MTKKPQPNPASTWFEMVIPAHAERVDLLTGALAELGVTGTEIREPRPGAAEVVFYLEATTASAAAAAASALTACSPALAAADIEVRGDVSSKVWTENWRSHFAPVRVGRRLTIVPPWNAEPDGNRVTIVINPGGAFGTGRHETTWLCLEAVEHYVRPGMQVADVGSGSGILAVAAARLGATHVVAVDIDPAAVDATRENAAANGVDDRIVVAEGSIPPTSGVPYDLVVANIYSDTLVALSENLVAITAVEGVLVLSGIEATRSGELEAAFTRHGLVLAARHVRGEWAALVFGRSRA